MVSVHPRHGTDLSAAAWKKGSAASQDFVNPSPVLWRCPTASWAGWYPPNAEAVSSVSPPGMSTGYPESPVVFITPRMNCAGG